MRVHLSGPKTYFPVDDRMERAWLLLLSFLTNGAGVLLLLAIDYDGRPGNAFVNGTLALVAVIAGFSGYYCRRVVKATLLESVITSMAVPVGFAIYLWDRVPATDWEGAVHFVILGFAINLIALFGLGWWAARRKEYPPLAYPKFRTPAQRGI